MSHPQIIWANRPGCSRPVAEIWIGESDLWFTLFVDDDDRILKTEVFPVQPEGVAHVIDLAEVERAIEAAKRELLAMTGVRAL
jgi:hypothetical protein